MLVSMAFMSADLFSRQGNTADATFRLLKLYLLNFAPMPYASAPSIRHAPQHPAACHHLRVTGLLRAHPGKVCHHGATVLQLALVSKSGGTTCLTLLVQYGIICFPRHCLSTTAD